MMIDKKFLNKLKEFGLNSYEAKIWAALLSRGISTAGELSDISNVPRSRAYDVLESLEKKGFIVMKIGKPIKYIAVQPQEVIERVKKSVQMEADTRTKLIDDMKDDDILQELELLYTKGIDIVEPTELSGAIKDRNNLYSNLNMMINGAEKSVDIMTTASEFARKADVLRKSIEKAKKRGVKVRIAAPMLEENKKAFEILKTIASLKHVDNIRARFCIVDGREITFSLMDDVDVNPSYDAGVWVNTPFFASAMQKMFDTVWQGAKVVVKE